MKIKCSPIADLILSTVCLQYIYECIRSQCSFFLIVYNPILFYVLIVFLARFFSIFSCMPSANCVLQTIQISMQYNAYGYKWVMEVSTEYISDQNNLVFVCDYAKKKKIRSLLLQHIQIQKSKSINLKEFQGFWVI